MADEDRDQHEAEAPEDDTDDVIEEEPLDETIVYEDSLLYRIRHTTAHIMAQAVLERFPLGKIDIGPPIAQGFYYNFSLPRPLTPDDLAAIEARMREIIRADFPVVRRVVQPDEAGRLFKDQPYKLVIVEDILQRATDEYGAPLKAGQQPTLTTYKQDTFEDLCRGPHVERTGQINPDAIKLLAISAAHYRKDQNQPMLQRIYGTAWLTPEDLNHFLWQQEEAKKRDHRKLGKQLGLFALSPEVTAYIGPGIPLFLPKGEMIRHLMEQYVREVQEAHDYQHVWTSHLARVRLYQRSRHWEHFRPSMFPKMHEDRDEHKGETPEEREGDDFELKPMNCPSHFTLYRSRPHSYRELPIRYAEFATLYRYEAQDQLGGLTRVRALTQDDSHIFVRHDQIQAEFGRIVDLMREILGTYGLTDYSVRLSLPDFNDTTKFHGNRELWDRAVADLRAALESKGLSYEAVEGEAAFYGPKMDVMARDALGRDWQLSTIQLDFYQPENFQLEYIAEDGSRQRPAVIHRAIMGSTERFLGVLIEHYAGAFPVWLAPVQAMVIPVSDRHNAYAAQVKARIRAVGLRVEVDARSQRMNAKVRDAQLQKIPYMLVVGDKEVADGTVALRLRTGENAGDLPLDEFIATASRINADRSRDLWPTHQAVGAKRTKAKPTAH